MNENTNTTNNFFFLLQLLTILLLQKSYFCKYNNKYKDKYNKKYSDDYKEYSLSVDTDIKQFLKNNMHLHYSQEISEDILEYIKIAAGAIGGVIFIALIVVIVCCCLKKQNAEELEKLEKENEEKRKQEIIEQNIELEFNNKRIKEIKNGNNISTLIISYINLNKHYIHI